MYRKIRCDGDSWKLFGFWGELNKTFIANLNQILVLTSYYHTYQTRSKFILHTPLQYI